MAYKLELWQEAKKKCRLNDNDIQKAKQKKKIYKFLEYIL